MRYPKFKTTITPEVYAMNINLNLQNAALQETQRMMNIIRK